MILEQIQNPKVTVTQKLPTTTRGQQGFGSTGINTTTVQNYDLGCKEPMVIPVKIRTSLTTIISNTTAMIDYRASTEFIHSELVQKLGLLLKEKSHL